MKIQDLFFLALLIFLMWKQNARLVVVIGSVMLLIAIPLFAFWVFFTAERLMWYSATLFLVAIFLQLIQIRKEDKNENRN